MRIALKPTYLATFLLVAITLVFRAPVSADALLVPMDIDALARASDSVVVAQVTGGSARALVKSDPRQGIVTDSRLQVSRVITGDRPDSLTITQPGGEVGGLGLKVAEQAELVRGTRLVLFLDEHDRIIGAEQGAMPVVAGRIEGLGITVDELAARVHQARGESVPSLGGPRIEDPTGFTIAISTEDAAITAASAQAATADAGTVGTASTITPASVPQVTSVTPTEQYAGVGRTITVAGTGFGASTGKVYLPAGNKLDGTLVACPIVSWSDTRIVATLPGKLASGKVVVEAYGGARAPDFPYTLSFSADNTNGTKFGAMPITYKVNENCPDMTGEAAEAQKAFAVWNASGSAFKLSYGGTTATAAQVRDGQNTIFFSTGVSGMLAANNYWYDGSGTLIESDIVINDNYTWGSNAGSNVWDVWSVLLHELGHSAGLDDQYPNYDRVMGAGVNGVNRRALTRFETTGAIFVNGVDATTPSTPSVSSTTHPVQTTWYPLTSATLQFSASAGTGISGYSYVVDSSAASVPDTAVDTASASATVPTAEGERWFHVRAIGSGGVAGPTAHYRLRSDSQAPAGTVQVGDATSQYTRSTTVQVTATLTDTSGIASMASDPGTGSFAAAVTYSPQSSVTLAGSDGTKTVRMRYRDEAGNERTDARTLVLDRVAPTTTSDARELYTDTATIRLGATDAVSGVAATYWRLDGEPAEPYAGAVTVSAEGQHVLQFYSVDRAGNTEDAPSVTFVIDRPNIVPPPPAISRLAGSNRYATAAAVSKSAFSNWSGVTDVVIANGMDAYSADPLAAAGLAGAHRAPLILVNSYLYSGKLVSAAEIALAQIKSANGGSVRIHVVGGPVPIPASVYSRLSALKGPAGSIERVYGSDRYSTSVAVANAVIAKRGIVNVPGVLVANGQDVSAFYDALAASSSSYATGRPLLLTQRNAVPASVTTILAGKLAGKPRVLVNASGYLSSTVLARAGATERMTSSTDRRVASAQIADFAISRGWVGRAHVGIANTLPDALGGGVALGEMGGPLLYTDAAQLSASAGTWLSEYKSEIRYVHVLGGESVIGAGTLGQIQDVVN